MKKGNVLILAIAVTALLGGSVWLYAKKTGGHEEKKTSLRIGVLLYRGDDTFIGTLGIPWSRRRRNMKRRPESA